MVPIENYMRLMVAWVPFTKAKDTNVHRSLATLGGRGEDPKTIA